jgi:uncharacterized protein (DUF2236 family)
MPTDRARLTITETDDVARMLDEAAEQWPEDREHRARLLKRLAERGLEAARAERAAEQLDWATAVAGAAGAAGAAAYPDGYLADLRDDWPA